MIGFTPSLSTAVWVGSDTNGPINTEAGTEIYGAGLPADIWTKTMDGALDGTPVEQFEGVDAESDGNSESQTYRPRSTRVNRPTRSTTQPPQQAGPAILPAPPFPAFPIFPAFSPPPVPH